MLLVHIGFASLRQFQCAPTAYSIVLYIGCSGTVVECLNKINRFQSYSLTFWCNFYTAQKAKVCSVAFILRIATTIKGRNV